MKKMKDLDRTEKWKNEPFKMVNELEKTIVIFSERTNPKDFETLIFYKSERTYFLSDFLKPYFLFWTTKKIA